MAAPAGYFDKLPWYNHANTSRGLYMPTYEYRCGRCRTKSAFFVKSFRQEFSPSCPECESDDMERVISAVSFKMGSSGTGAQSDFYRDASNIGRNVERNYDKSGVEMPQSVRKTIDDARAGKMPKGVDL